MVAFNGSGSGIHGTSWPGSSRSLAGLTGSLGLSVLTVTVSARAARPPDNTGLPVWPLRAQKILQTPRWESGARARDTGGASPIPANRGRGRRGERPRFWQIAALRITRRAALMAPRAWSQLEAGRGEARQPGPSRGAFRVRPAWAAALPAAAECPGVAVTATGKRIELRLRALFYPQPRRGEPPDLAGPC
jgi:hypothetical protein